VERRTEKVYGAKLVQFFAYDYGAYGVASVQFFIAAFKRCFISRYVFTSCVSVRHSSSIFLSCDKSNILFRIRVKRNGEARNTRGRSLECTLSDFAF
jgi:hypothetical protein